MTYNMLSAMARDPSSRATKQMVDVLRAQGDALVARMNRYEAAVSRAVDDFERINNARGSHFVRRDDFLMRASGDLRAAGFQGEIGQIGDPNKFLREYDAAVQAALNGLSSEIREKLKGLVEKARESAKFRGLVVVRQIGDRIYPKSADDLATSRGVAEGYRKQAIEAERHVRVGLKDTLKNYARPIAVRVGASAVTGFGAAALMAAPAMAPAAKDAARERCRTEHGLSDVEMTRIRQARAISDASVPAIGQGSGCALNFHSNGVAELLDDNTGGLSDGICRMMHADLERLRLMQERKLEMKPASGDGCKETGLEIDGRPLGRFRREGSDEFVYETAPTRHGYGTRINIKDNPWSLSPNGIECFRRTASGENQFERNCTQYQRDSIRATGAASREAMLNERSACVGGNVHLETMCETARASAPLNQALMVFGLQCRGGSQVIPSGGAAPVQ